MMKLQRLPSITQLEKLNESIGNEKILIAINSLDGFMPDTDDDENYDYKVNGNKLIAKDKETAKNMSHELEVTQVDHKLDGNIITINEGIWALPENNIELEEAKAKIIELEKFKDGIYGILGDDILFDELNIAIDRMNELILKAPTGKNWKQ